MLNKLFNIYEGMNDSMKKFKRIFFFTSTFPYGTGENFIENEIGTMCSYCDELYIIPINKTKDEKVRLCENKRIKIMTIKISWFRYLLLFLQMIIAEKVWKEIGFLYKNGNLNIYTLFSVAGFWLKGQARMDFVDAFFNKKVLSENDLLYSYWAGTTAYVVAGLSKKTKIFSVTRAHRYDIYQEYLMPYYIPFKEDTYSNINYICPISDDGGEYLKKKFPNIREKIHTVYLGTLDYGLNNSVEENVFKIVSCSNLVSVKRVNRIIEALADMDENIMWIHYGDGEQKAELEARAGMLPHNIRYQFKGRYTNKDLMKEYQNEHFDVFVNVSESEGLPVSIMEASSFGIPVIATDVGGTSEIVKNGYNGYLLDAMFEKEELVNKIKIFMYMSKEEKKIMRMNSRIVWEEKFMAKNNYEAFFRDLLHAL